MSKIKKHGDTISLAVIGGAAGLAIWSIGTGDLPADDKFSDWLWWLYGGLFVAIGVGSAILWTKG